MKALLGALTFALALLGLPAAADHERGAGYGYPPQSQGQQGRPGPYKGDQWRDPRRERQADRRERGEQRPPGRLTDEERRELHRDLDKANREIYRRRQQQR